MMDDRRTSITVPVVLDNEVNKYKDKKGIKTWNAALWDLVRKGLDAEKEKERS